ncbi:pesticidal protein Cry7Aa [Flavobacterium sp.]|uniref:glycoside hydrolase family 130 protein n=1 Tax=Flavobacterium sp. TaxID=239 RepID=UPI00260DB156|nr:pesticidal protein Cry7Aa [Flavobacterium sp.]
MLTVNKEGIILEKRALGFEIEGVLNPAVIHYGDFVHILYRAVAKGNYSTVGYCKMEGFSTIVEQRDVPVMISQFDYEHHGVEDPRVVKIDDLFYMSYCAYDGVNALGAVATSTDLIHWEKQGIVVPQILYQEFIRLAETKGHLNEKYIRFNTNHGIHQNNKKKVLVWDKNVVFFPRRIHGKLFFLHRIKPDIQIASCHELSELTPEYWQTYLLDFDSHIVMSPKYKHEVSYLGGGCPPIETTHGWLIIYHGVYDTIKGYVYCACAALLDLENPQKEIARLPYALFKPELNWELEGEVNNVCFPTGTYLDGDTLYIYYGAADERIACSSVSLSELLTELLLNPNTNESQYSPKL